MNKTKLKQTEIGEIPEGWSIGKVSDLVNVRSGYAIKSSDFCKSGVGVIKIKNIDSKRVDLFDTDKVTPAFFETLPDEYRVSYGDVLIAMTGATIGKTGKIRSTKSEAWGQTLKCENGCIKMGGSMRKIILHAFLILTFITAMIPIGEVYARGRKSTGTYKSYKGGKAIDGDTFRYKGNRYRVQQYNAPERGQPGAQKATRSLQRKIDSGNYKWKPVTTDVYGRTIIKEKRK